jgi:AGCS family alanine or glycine:cation symporter
MIEILESVNHLVWGIPALIMILGVGIFLTLRTGFVQLRLFPEAMKHLWTMLHRGRGNSSFRALCTALGATVGTGNLVGVAGAICLGGPGSIFWMWICGIFGMAVKYTEALLAVRYREGKPGDYASGPMYIISRGMGKRYRWLAWMYSLFGVTAAFGVGNAAQINAVVTGINACTGRETAVGNFVMGVILAAAVGVMLTGGASRIGAAAEKLVPLASAGYILLCFWVLLRCWDRVGDAFGAIVTGAFRPRAVTGGVLGSAFQTLRTGCSRGVFTNEAGMGTAAIAHGTAEQVHPAQQGMMGIVEVFLDTIVICTLTALVILCSGAEIPYGVDAGGSLTMDAFELVCGSWTGPVLTAALCCFAFATILGWGLYGARCAQFLLGDRAWKGFAAVQIGMVVASAVMKTGLVWTIAEILNGLMAIPNLIALAACSGEAARLTKEFTQSVRWKDSGCNMGKTIL